MMQTVERMSFEDFHAANSARAHRYALRLTKNSEDAADLAQETFFRAFRAFDRWDANRPCEAWLMQIMKNVFLDQMRAKKRRLETVSFDAFTGITGPYDVPDTDMSPEERMLSDEFSEPVQQALSRLSPEQRVIIFNLLKGVSYKNLANSLGCRIETVKTRVNRARIALKRNLALLDPKFAKMAKSLPV